MCRGRRARILYFLFLQEQIKDIIIITTLLQFIFVSVRTNKRHHHLCVQFSDDDDVFYLFYIHISGSMTIAG